MEPLFIYCYCSVLDGHTHLFIEKSPSNPQLLLSLLTLTTLRDTGRSKNFKLLLHLPLITNAPLDLFFWNSLYPSNTTKTCQGGQSQTYAALAHVFLCLVTPLAALSASDLVRHIYIHPWPHVS